MWLKTGSFGWLLILLKKQFWVVISLVKKRQFWVVISVVKKGADLGGY